MRLFTIGTFLSIRYMRGEHLTTFSSHNGDREINLTIYLCGEEFVVVDVPTLFVSKQTISLVLNGMFHSKIK